MQRMPDAINLPSTRFVIRVSVSIGITVLSGCPSAEFHRRVQEGDREGAIDVAKWY